MPEIDFVSGLKSTTRNVVLLFFGDPYENLNSCTRMELAVKYDLVRRVL